MSRPWQGIEAIDILLKELKEDILLQYWPEQSALYLNHYEELWFPFKEIEVPKFEISVNWGMGDLIAFLSTWSVIQRYIKDTGQNPFDLIIDKLEKSWSKEYKMKSLPLYFRVGRHKPF